ncbi:MAG TPA: hypothetical protein DDY91_06550 [Planctomycetaceae bacterium]|nr:hypothetical protein [Planctomycetaceae bacterium]
MTQKTILAPQVFLSYAIKDQAVARQIADCLEKRGLNVFLDEAALVAGVRVDADLARTLGKSVAVVPVLSGNSTRSTWVERELQVALQKVPHVFPVLLDSGGRASWVWPLVSHLQAVEVHRSSVARHRDLERLSNAVAEAISTPKSAKPPNPAPGQPIASLTFSTGPSPRRR